MSIPYNYVCIIEAQCSCLPWQTGMTTQFICYQKWHVTESEDGIRVTASIIYCCTESVKYFNVKLPVHMKTTM
jgi:hypothetical protein